jgi:septal ring factor EnvC (AmiA/AmiB activator)
MRCVLLSLVLSTVLTSLSFGQNFKSFACPMKKGKIIVEHRGFDEGNKSPGAEFEGKNNNVYSCSPGLVKAIENTNGRIIVYIEFENYFFSYHNFRSVAVTKGQTIKAGELIGVIANKERLFLITSKGKTLIEPASILKCKVVHRYLE